MFRIMTEKTLTYRLKKLNKIGLNLFVTAFLILVFVGNPMAASLTPQQQAELNAIDLKIGALNANIAKNKQLQRTAETEVASIDAQTEIILLQISQTAGQITSLNDKIASLGEQIALAEADLANQKKLLGEYIKQMYIDGQTSQVQLILTSNNFSDFVDRSQYLNTMQEKVKSAVVKIEALRTELTNKKTDIEVSKSTAESLQSSQVAQRDALNSQQAYKQSVINGLEASNKQLTKQKNDSYADKQALSIAYGEVLTSGSSGYPYGNPTPLSIADTPDPWGYYKGECTSYVAWKRLSIGSGIPRAIGNGGEWTGERAGYTESNVPHYGDIMVFPNFGYYGHVAFVEATRADGWVYVSEYNVNQFAETEGWINPFTRGGGTFYITTNRS